jgi:hypothetical protein
MLDLAITSMKKKNETNFFTITKIQEKKYIKINVVNIYDINFLYIFIL